MQAKRLPVRLRAPWPSSTPHLVRAKSSPHKLSAPASCLRRRWSSLGRCRHRRISLTPHPPNYSQVRNRNPKIQNRIEHPRPRFQRHRQPLWQLPAFQPHRNRRPCHREADPRLHPPWRAFPPRRNRPSHPRDQSNPIRQFLLHRPLCLPNQ